MKHIARIHEGKGKPYKPRLKKTNGGYISSVKAGKRYECSECDANYAALHRLNEHIASVHEGARFLCVECDASFPVFRSLEYHISVVHKGKRYDCSLCETKFTALHSLNRHMIRKHNDTSNIDQKDSLKKEWVTLCSFWVLMWIFLKVHIYPVPLLAVAFRELAGIKFGAKIPNSASLSFY